MYQAIRDEWERATKEGRELIIPLIKERTKMAMAKKCDRCETLYEKLDENPPIFLLRDNCNTYMSFDLVDLCSGCQADLESWFKNESVTVTGKTYRKRNTIRNFVEEIIADHDRIDTESKEIKKKVKRWDK